ncbi:hypothetical protein AB0I10_08925 [Streptomyces sp. NPDC050636]|uniref:hypothetical protein n=1 Tax=Streptomyces sp. NPDC050636 TaxID=3154510 RepID=UPI0034235E31
MADTGGTRWNSETQTWEKVGTPRPAPYTGPMPPRPTFEPAPPAPPPDGLPPSTPAYDPYAGPGLAPEPAPVPSPGGRRRTTALVAGAAVAVIAAGFGGGYLLWGRNSEDPAAARPPTNRASASASITATSPASPTTQTPSSPSAATEIPDGYHLVDDEEGFTTAVPDGWTRSLRKTGVFYTAPDDRGLVQIFEITEPDYTPRESLEKASEGLQGNPGYEEISLEPLNDPTLSSDAAQLVYSYDSDRLDERVQVVDCVFTAADGRRFAVLVLGPAADWPQQEETQRIALHAFVPTS